MNGTNSRPFTRKQALQILKWVQEENQDQDINKQVKIASHIIKTHFKNNNFYYDPDHKIYPFLLESALETP